MPGQDLLLKNGAKSIDMSQAYKGEEVSTLLKFTPNIQKIIETLLWIVGKRPGIDLYHVMKIMFAADCYHLSMYGRPITGDFYVAVKHGAMPSITKDIIDEDPWTISEYGINESIITRKGHSLYPVRGYNRLKFSKSDIEALEFGFSEYANLSTFWEVREKNHKHIAWRKAAERQGYDMSKETKFTELHQIVDFADMIDDPQMLADLKELGECTGRMVV